MLSRKKKPGSRTAVRAVCSSSSTGEDWSFADPLHPPRGATLDLVPGLAAGDHTRSDPCLVFLSASPSGRCSSVSLQTATGCCKNLTPTVVLEQPGVGFIELSLLAFTALALLIMLVERTPELLVFPVGLAAWAIGLSHGEFWQLMVAYSLLCVLTFASQFTWQVIPSTTNWLPATRLHRVLALGGQACVVLAIIAQGGLSADAWPLVHVGAGALIILALLLFWHGRLQNTHAYRRYSYYGAGLLLSLVLPWELIAFRQTSLDLLALGPASYLALIAPLLIRDESLPEHHRTGQAAAIVGAALLLLPTLWLSFNDNNLLPTLILAGEAMALLLLGIGTRLRIFVLSGAGLVIVAILHSLFLQAFALPLSLTLLGLILIAIATGLSIARHRLQVAWSRWE